MRNIQEFLRLDSLNTVYGLANGTTTRLHFVIRGSDNNCHKKIISVSSNDDPKNFLEMAENDFDISTQFDGIFCTKIDTPYFVTVTIENRRVNVKKLDGDRFPSTGDVLLVTHKPMPYTHYSRGTHDLIWPDGDRPDQENDAAKGLVRNGYHYVMFKLTKDERQELRRRAAVHSSPGHTTDGNDASCSIM